MASPNIRDMLNVPGRLSVGPSSLTSAYPHGGTGLGVVRKIAVRIESGVNYITAEEYGGERTEGIYKGDGILISGILSSYDKKGIETLFPNTSIGSVSGKRVISAPGTIRAGEKASNRSVVLVFTPDDVDRHQMVVMRRAIPALADAAELALAVDEEWGVPFMFAGIRDTSGRLYVNGQSADLSV